MSGHSTKIDELYDLVGHRSLLLASCSKCYGMATKYSVHASWTWLIHLECTACNHSWHSCTTCVDNKLRQMTNPAQVQRHKERYHTVQPTHPPDSSISLSRRIGSSLDDEKKASATNTTSSNDSSGDNIFADCLATRSSTFFSKQREGKGLAYLVGQALFHGELEDAENKLNPDEVKMYIRLAGFTSSLKRGQRVELCKLLDDINAPKRKHPADNWITCNVPTTYRKLRRVVTEGSHSLIQNIPHPKVVEISGHSYVSPLESLADLLAHGVEVGVIDLPLDSNGEPIIPKSVNQLCDSLQASYIFRVFWHQPGSATAKVIFFKVWKDGFEPNRHSKANRGSVWLKTITFSSPPGLLDSAEYTYPVSIGQSGDDHEPVEKQFSADIAKLSQEGGVTFYDGATKENVVIYGKVLIDLQDLPERSESNGITLGGVFTSCWGWSLNVGAVRHILPACLECNERLFSGIPPSPDTRCTVCTSWKVTKDNELLRYKPPPGYPQSELRNGELLIAKKITFAGLNKAVHKAHKCYVNGSWNRTNVESYLSVEGLSASSIRSTFTCAENDRLGDWNKTGRDASDDDVCPPLVGQENDKKELSPWGGRAQWNRDMELSQFPDAPMHQGVLGVSKTSQKMIVAWLKNQRTFSSFVAYARGKLGSVSDMRLNWLRFLEYGRGTFGGWVAADHLDFVRVIKWFYTGLSQQKTPDLYVEPDTPQERWSVDQNKAWLRSRGLKLAGRKADLQERVEIAQAQGLGIPDVPLGGSVVLVEHMVVSLTACLSRLLLPEANEEILRDKERHLHIFLSLSEAFDSGLRDASKRDKPQFEKKPNFCSITNWIGNEKLLGPMQLHYESRWHGEKYIQKVKPHCHGQYGKWYLRATENVLHQQAFTHVLSKLDAKSESKRSTPSCSGYRSSDEEGHPVGLDPDLDSDRDEDDTSSAARIKNNLVLGSSEGQRFHRRYKSDKVCLDAFAKGLPLSAVYTSCGRMGMYLGGRKLLLFDTFEYAEERICLAYFRFSIGITVELPDKSAVKHHCCLLPRLNEQALGQPRCDGLYAVITSNWLELNQHMKFELPTIPKWEDVQPLLARVKRPTPAKKKGRAKASTKKSGQHEVDVGHEVDLTNNDDEPDNEFTDDEDNS